VSDHEPERRWADAAELAMDEGDWERALSLLEAAPADDGVRWLLSAGVWIELDRLEQAREDLSTAEHLLGDGDPDVLHAKARLAIADWDFVRATRWLERLDPEDWGAQLLLDRSFLADATGDHDRAHSLLREAHRLDPEAVPSPLRLSPDAFETIVREAAEDLPDEFRAVFDEVAVVIDPMPARAIVGGEHPPDLLGLFVGPPVAEREAGPGGEPPPTIFLFQRNLERIAADEEELRSEIRTTLYHELGHALGFDEEGVDAMGLG